MTAPTGPRPTTAVPAQRPVIASADQARAAAGEAFSFLVVASGYPKPTFTTQGALPRGVSLSASGALSGTLAVTGSYTVVISAANSAGTARQNFTLTVRGRG